MKILRFSAFLLSIIVPNSTKIVYNKSLLSGKSDWIPRKAPNDIAIGGLKVGGVC
jgi:hypothetical protein